MPHPVDEIHAYWFGPLDGQGLAGAEYQHLWFSASAATDAALRERFGQLVEDALAGKLASWAKDDRALVALVLLLDQFTRNIYRGTSRAFAGDPQALELASQAIATGRHLQLATIHRVFLYMPLEHSEELPLQQQCVQLFAQLQDEAGSEHVAGFARYARAHHDVIAQFGRFPHRNEILGRESTPQELAHLAQHGGF
jgi:uncharacterized protein (DUF924 family)